jgi:hypothetical protein
MNAGFLEPYVGIVGGVVSLIIGEVGRLSGKVLVPKAGVADRKKNPGTFWFAVCFWHFVGAAWIGYTALNSIGWFD